MNIEKRDRYRGAMVGTLCGDALGAPYEWKKAAEFADDLKLRGAEMPSNYELFDYLEPWKKKRMVKKGHPTDDSELAAALAMSFVAHPEFSAEDLYDRLRGFIILRESVLTDEAYGSGSTLRAALDSKTYRESRAKFKRNEVPTPPSNGSLMRCISVPLRCGPRTTTQEIVDLAHRQSAITHRHSYCLAACAAYSVWVARILDGRPTMTSGQSLRLDRARSRSRFASRCGRLTLPRTSPTELSSRFPLAATPTPTER